MLHLSPDLTAPTPSWRAKLPFFYGWVIVASCSAVLAISYGVYYSFSVFLVALLDQFGWSRAAASGVFSLFAMSTAFGSVGGGALMDRLGPARVMPAGGILLAIGLFGTSRMTQLWEFYLYFGLICGLALSLAGWVPCVALVSRWFSRKQGLAMGFTGAGIGLGTVVMVPMCQYIISTSGWQSAYLFLAAVALVGIAPQAALFQVAGPELLGLKPDGAAGRGSATPTKTGRRVQIVDPDWASRPWTVASAARTSRFWMLGLFMTTLVIINQMLWVHQVAYLVDSGYDTMVAAWVVGLAGFLSMPAKVMWGELCDRLGRELSLTLGTVSVLLAIALLILAGSVHSVLIVVLFGIAFAIGYGVAPPVNSTSSADLFYGANFGSIYGALAIGIGIGTALGAWMAGYVFDVTGSYIAAFLIGGSCSIVSSACLWLVAPRRVRKTLA